MTSELVPWRGHSVPVLTGEISRYSINDYFNWMQESFKFGGITYNPGQGYTTTYGKNPSEPIGNNFVGYVQGLLYADGVVAAVEQTRIRIFSQAPLLFQERRDGRPGDLYDDPSLDLAREPWIGGTTSDLQTRALLYADFGGNAYVVAADGELVVLRPDWVEIILAERYHNGGRLGFKQVGIAYYEGGRQASDAAVFTRGEYAHFAPLPDPLASYRGMSWLTPVLREVQSDIGATVHGRAFFENAATPNLAVSLPKEITPTQFEEFRAKMNAQHQGASNAYRTLYTGGGADVTVIGANMQQMDFRGVQGKLETRIANAAGIHPAIVGLSEGMQGSSLNAGNYGMAKRATVDTTGRHLWQNWCGSMQVLFPPPKAGDRLWYDARDIPFLHEDQKDAAEIQQTLAATISSYITSGFEPDSAVEAVDADDRKLLKHSGRVSVQLFEPGQGPDADGDGAPDTGPVDFGALREGFSAQGEEPAAEPATRSRFDDFQDVERRYHPDQLRVPKGFEGGGRFRSLSTRMVKILDDWIDQKGDGDPLEEFDQGQLREVAKDLGLLQPRQRTTKPQLKGLLYQAIIDDRGGKSKRPAPDVPAKAAKKAAPSKATAPKAPAKKALSTKGAAKDDEALHATKMRLFTDDESLGSFERLGPEVRDSVLEYQGDKGARFDARGYSRINDYLRTGKGDADAKRHVANIDRAFADPQSQLDRDVVLYRGLDGRTIDLTDGDMSGRTSKNKGFTSATTSDEVARDFVWLTEDLGAEGKPVIVRTVVRKGTPAIQMAPEEGELLLPRDAEVRVLTDHGSQSKSPWSGEDVFGDPVRFLDVEISWPRSEAAPAKKATPRKAAAPKVPFDAGQSARRLEAATSRDEAHAALDGLTKPQLLEVAREHGMTSIAPGLPRDKMVGRMIDLAGAGRYDSQTEYLAKLEAEGGLATLRTPETPGAAAPIGAKKDFSVSQGMDEHLAQVYATPRKAAAKPVLSQRQERVGGTAAAKLTPAQATRQLDTAEDWAQAARDGRISRPAAVRRIREMAQGQANSAAYIGLGNPREMWSQSQRDRFDEMDAETKRLRALADELEAKPVKAAKEAPTADAIVSDGSLTLRQKRLRLKALGYTPEQINDLAPLAGAKKAAAKYNPRMPGRDGLPDPDARDAAIEAMAGEPSESEIASRLEQYNARQLRAVAKVLSLPIGSKLTTDEIRNTIAHQIVFSRGRSTVRSETTDDDLERRADVTPGNDELHHYWTRGEGLAKWLGHPHEWTSLYHHLLKYAPNPEAAKRWASAWFHEVKGFHAGSDLHRVEHGKPPRGNRIGPG